jgi:hypothetical protein
VIDASAIRVVLAVLMAWLNRQEDGVLRYLIEENRLLRRQLRGHRLLREIATIVGLAGVFSTPLYLAGIWHIFEASKPGGTRWSLPPFMLLVTAFSIAPFVHGSFFYVAEILKTIGQLDPPSQPVLVALATRATLWLFIAYGVLAVAASVGFAWLTVAIARSKMLYRPPIARSNRRSFYANSVIGSGTGPLRGAHRWSVQAATR